MFTLLTIILISTTHASHKLRRTLTNRPIISFVDPIETTTPPTTPPPTSLDNTNAAPPTPTIPLGSPVVVHGKFHGILSFAGKVKFGDPSVSLWYGICLTPPDTGKNDGTVLGVHYFDCTPGLGLFTLPENVRIEDGTMDASTAVRAIDKIGGNLNPLEAPASSVRAAASSSSSSSAAAEGEEVGNSVGAENGPVERVMGTVSPSQIPVGVASATDYLSALDAKISQMVKSEDASHSVPSTGDVDDATKKESHPTASAVEDAASYEQLEQDNRNLDLRMGAMKQANQGMQQQMISTFNPPTQQQILIDTVDVSFPRDNK